MQLAIDFGTTNTLAATLQNNTPHVLAQIPSLVYVQTGEVISGEMVREKGLDHQQDNRLFRNFKRGIVASPAPAPRLIDGTLWGDRDAAQHFIRQMLTRLPLQKLDQLVLTAPVAAFESYLAWLSDAMQGLVSEKTQMQIVDESTAAALGYAVTEPGAVVLVVDFGGGTLDLSLVQLPEKTGGWLNRHKNHTAKVIAKAGHILGGSDVDQWLLLAALEKVGVQPESLGNDYAAMLTRCEQVKIALSTQTSAALTFTVLGETYHLTFTRADFNHILDKNGFWVALRRTIDKVMQVARQRGIFKEDIRYVLMVGGTSLIPTVQDALANYFTRTAIRAEKPFTAVVEGALQVAAGCGLDDYLAHSYGLRYLENGQHFYTEIIPAGTPYPTAKPFEIYLAAAHDQQTELEFVFGEIETEAVSMVEVRYEQGQAVFVAHPDENAHQIMPLNEATPVIIPLHPCGEIGRERLKAQFSVNAQHQLHLTVVDLRTKKTLLRDVPVITLK